MNWIENGFHNWAQGWINSNEQTKEWFNNGMQNWKNGWIESFKMSGDWLIDVLVIAAIIGVIFNMAGLGKWGNKLILGSLIIGLLMKVMF